MPSELRFDRRRADAVVDPHEADCRSAQLAATETGAVTRQELITEVTSSVRAGTETERAEAKKRLTRLRNEFGLSLCLGSEVHDA